MKFWIKSIRCVKKVRQIVNRFELFFIVVFASLLSTLGDFMLLFVASFIFNAWGLGKSRLGILLLLSIPGPFVDLDAPKLYPFSDCFDLSSAPVRVALELILQYSALLLGHAHATSFFFRYGSRSGWSRLTHHLLRDSIIGALVWGGWIKVFIPALLFAVWGIFRRVLILLLRQCCCFQSDSNLFLIARVSLEQACFVRNGGRRRCWSRFACQIECQRLCLMHLLCCTQRHRLQNKIRNALWSWTTLPRCFLILGLNILICSILKDVWFKCCLSR